MKKYTENIRFKKLGLIVVLFAGMIFNSCEKLIDLNPYTSVSENTAFTTPSLIELSVMGMYQAAQRGDYAGNWRGYPWGSAFVQQFDCRGEDAVNNQAFYQFTYTNTISTTTSNNVYWWSDSYRLINRCNIVIEGVQKAAKDGIITDAVAKGYESEARFLRALTHWGLLVNFAKPYKHTADGSHLGVPYREKSYTTPTAVEEGVSQSRNTVAVCYSKILADLDFVEQNSLKKADRTSAKLKIVRVTAESAVALKTRIYLHMWDMNKVISEASKLLPGGSFGSSYTLTASPAGAFNSNYDNTESIFSIENSANNNPGVNAALASQYNRRLLVNISPIIWRNARWLVDDKRRSTTDMVFANNGRYYTLKYKDVTNYSDAAPIIRYAEVLLNVAEAYARRNSGNDLTLALDNLNKVRNRALATPASQAYTAGSFANASELLSAILDERRIEFNMEGMRWPDIHRRQQDPVFPISGIPAKLANATPAIADYTLGTPYSGALGVAAIPYTDYRFLWPIPQAEIDANPTLAKEQNPGW